MIYTNELTHEITNENSSENCFSNRYEYHNSDVQMLSNLSETDKRSRYAMLKSKLAENNNTLSSTPVNELPYKKVNISISCFIIDICTVV